MSGISLTVPLPQQQGPFLGLDIASATSYDCYLDTNPPLGPAVLPEPTPSELQGSKDAFAAQPPVYNNVGDQDSAFANAIKVWSQSGSEEIEGILGSLAAALDLPPKSKKAKKLGDVGSSYGPPMQAMQRLKMLYVVPPMVSVGA